MKKIITGLILITVWGCVTDLPQYTNEDFNQLERILKGDTKALKIVKKLKKSQANLQKSSQVNVRKDQELKRNIIWFLIYISTACLFFGGVAWAHPMTHSSIGRIFCIGGAMGIFSLVLMLQFIQIWYYVAIGFAIYLASHMLLELIPSIIKEVKKWKT